MTTFATSLSDPVGSQPITAAVAWVQATLLGTFATTVAVIAISVVGVRMLTGHIDTKRGMTTIGGCFILFGASTIAAGLQTVGSDAASIDYPTIQAAPASESSTISPEKSPNADLNRTGIVGGSNS